ncbi:Tyrocidine synthase 3 [compost metagenome]
MIEVNRSIDSTLVGLYADKSAAFNKISSSNAITVQLGTRFTACVQEFCRREQLSEDLFFLAAYLILLYRYTLEERIVIGCPASLVALKSETWKYETPMFMNLFCDTKMKVRDYIHVLNEELLKLDVLTDSQVEKIGGEAVHSSLYTPMMFMFQTEISSSKIPSICIRIDSTTAPSDAALTIEYPSQIFELITATRLLENYKQTILSMLKDNAEVSIIGLDVLSSLDRAVLEEWNNTFVSCDTEICFHERFELEALRNPRQIALEKDQVQITYEKLNEMASALATYLRQRGVVAGSRIGLFFRHGLELPISVLAVLKAGGVCVPLDPSFPKDRLESILTDVKCRLLLTEQVVESLLDGLKVDKLSVSCDALLNQRVNEQEIFEIDTFDAGSMPGDLAFIFYTSGSTGQPKGVGVSHRAGATSQLPETSTVQLDVNDRLLFLTPITFAGLKGELFWPWYAGSTVVVVNPDGNKDAKYLANTIACERITTVSMVPSMLRLFLEEVAVEKCSQLKHVFCLGEQLDMDLIKQFYRRLPNTTLFNLYGQTEASPSAYWSCSADSPAVYVGKPVANIKFYILDSFLQPVPVGSAGELYIGGLNLSEGYLNRPELTSEKFIQDLKLNRLYKTGDLARFSFDGNLQLLGRKDDLIKLRGVRIEPGEIEILIRQFEAVKDVTVNVVDDETLGRQLAAYIVPMNETSLDAAAIKEDLKRKLPALLIPTYYISLPSIPRAHSGKVDRKRLPKPYRKRVSEQWLINESDTMEETVLAIWQNFFETEGLHLHDNFFELGGHSLFLNQLIASINKTLNVNISVIDVITRDVTIANMIELLKQNQNGSKRKKDSLIDRLLKELDMSREELLDI